MEPEATNFRDRPLFRLTATLIPSPIRKPTPTIIAEWSIGDWKKQAEDSSHETDGDSERDARSDGAGQEAAAHLEGGHPGWASAVLAPHTYGGVHHAARADQLLATAAPQAALGVRVSNAVSRLQHPWKSRRPPIPDGVSSNLPSLARPGPTLSGSP